MEHFEPEVIMQVASDEGISSTTSPGTICEVMHETATEIQNDDHHSKNISEVAEANVYKRDQKENVPLNQEAWRGVSHPYYEDCNDQCVQITSIESNQSSSAERTYGSPCADKNMDYEEEVVELNYSKISDHQQKKETSTSHNSYNVNYDKQHCYSYSGEYTYQRKDMTSMDQEICQEKNYVYQLDNERCMSQNGEYSATVYESHSDTYKTYPESPNYLHKENNSILDQEECQESGYEKENTVSYTRERMTEDNQVIGIIKEYVYSESDKIYELGTQSKNNDNSHQDMSYRYQLSDENVCQNENTSFGNETTNDQGHSYQPVDSNLYDREESSAMDYNNSLSYGYHDYSTYHANGQSTIDKKPCYNGDLKPEEGKDIKMKNHIIENEMSCDNGYKFEDENINHQQETLAVDLRISRPIEHLQYSDDLETHYNKKEPMNVSQFLESFYFAEGSREKLQTKINMVDSSSKPDYIMPDQICYEEECRDMNSSENAVDCISYETTDMIDHRFWDAGTNTDPTPMFDKGSQTRLQETKDVAVQTDIKPKILACSFFKNFEEEIEKQTCPICQRVYISKHSLDRHLKTHKKEMNNKVIANVRFTTEAKLQICKRSGKNQHSKLNKPIIIQIPRCTYQCEMCLKHFPNQKKKDEHDCIRPFPMTKCPACHIKFYTTGALNEHIKITHNSENAYYCIFCNKSFDAGYNFHLHLDQHLSSQ